MCFICDGNIDFFFRILDYYIIYEIKMCFCVLGLEK